MEKQVRKTFLPQDIAVLDGTTEDIDLHPWAKGGAAGIICFG